MTRYFSCHFFKSNVKILSCSFPKNSYREMKLYFFKINNFILWFGSRNFILNWLPEILNTAKNLLWFLRSSLISSDILSHQWRISRFTHSVDYYYWIVISIWPENMSLKFVLDLIVIVRYLVLFSDQDMERRPSSKSCCLFNLLSVPLFRYQTLPLHFPPYYQSTTFVRVSSLFLSRSYT